MRRPAKEIAETNYVTGPGIGRDAEVLQVNHTQGTVKITTTAGTGVFYANEPIEITDRERP